MARCAVAGFGEAAFVRILVASVAVSSRRLGGRRRVARSARFFVRALKRKARLVVVVVVDDLPLDFGAVALRALLLAEQRLAVDVLVTGRAVGGPVGQAERRARVAAVARNTGMLGFDREARIGVVIKLHRIELAPVLGIVAALAVGDLLVQLTVGRLVTANTGHRRQKEARTSGIRLLLVTVFAIDHRVSALQCEPRGRVVVELVLPTDGHPAVEVGFHPAVFFVTQHAGPTERFG